MIDESQLKGGQMIPRPPARAQPSRGNAGREMTEQTEITEDTENFSHE
jgi:hypothetical protein